MNLFSETNNNQKHEEIAKKFLLATYTVEPRTSIHQNVKMWWLLMGAVVAYKNLIISHMCNC